MKCPTCKKVLRTKQGMRQHHAKVHGESLPNRTCKGCGTAFYDSKARRDFCDDCNPNAGRNNGNWKGGKETATCRTCGSTFEFYPSDKKGVYCPECVAGSDEFLGEPYYMQVERVSKDCKQCGREMSVLRSDLDRGGGKFCCFDCLCNWMAKDGRAERTDYGRNWKRVRRKALHRDDHLCQHCGITAAELGQEPDVHHKKPVKEFEDPSEAHTLDNVVCLCRGCHRRIEVGAIDSSFNHSSS